MPSERPRILCVDDEPRVLAAFERTLGFDYDVAVADGGAKALVALQKDGPFSVIVSDLRMHGIDGLTLLRRTRELRPDTVRILLTGNANLTAAIKAVNTLDLFRFLTKPCPPDELQRALADGVAQHELIVRERDLRERTLRESVRLLTDTLSFVAPDTFGRYQRVRQVAGLILEAAGAGLTWEVEVASALVLVPFATLPPETHRRLTMNEPLDEADVAAVAELPELAESLIARIPHIETVRAVLRVAMGADRTSVELSATSRVRLGGAALRLAFDFATVEASGLSPSQVAARLYAAKRHDPKLLDALLRCVEAHEGKVRAVPLRGLEVGMVIVDTVYSKGGAAILARGHEVTPKLLTRLRNFSRGLGVAEPIRVLVEEK